jgi:hypothetical protein
MSFLLQPWHLMFFVFAGWANRQQQEVTDYLRTENQILNEKLGKKRILLNDDQRRRLGVKGEILGRKLLEEFGMLFTPDTILRWHRELVAKKWDYSEKSSIPARRRMSNRVTNHASAGHAAHPVRNRKSTSTAKQVIQSS